MDNDHSLQILICHQYLKVCSACQKITCKKIQQFGYCPTRLENRLEKDQKKRLGKQIRKGLGDQIIIRKGSGKQIRKHGNSQ